MNLGHLARNLLSSVGAHLHFHNRKTGQVALSGLCSGNCAYSLPKQDNCTQSAFFWTLSSSPLSSDQKCLEST